MNFTIALNAHCEGTLLARSLKNALLLKAHAVREGFETELLVIGDRMNAETRAVLRDLAVWDRFEEFDFGDLAHARNAATQLCRSEFLTFLDGDDFACHKWLTQAFREFERETASGSLIIRPQVVVSFGRRLRLWWQLSQLDGLFDNSCLFEFNPYASVAFARRSTFEKYPYRSMKEPGFAFEDWLWNADTLAGGCIHHTAPQTSYFYRRKQDGSLAEAQYAFNGCIGASHYFDNDALIQNRGARANAENWARYQTNEFPQWLVEQTREISKLESEVSLDPKVLQQYSVRCITKSDLTEPYLKLKQKTDRISSVDTLIIEGNELHLVNQEASQTRLALGFPEGLSLDKKAAILLRLIIQRPPRSVVLQNGDLAAYLKKGYLPLLTHLAMVN